MSETFTIAMVRAGNQLLRVGRHAGSVKGPPLLMFNGIGGNIELVGNVEYTIPVYFGIRVAAFLDIGNVWGPDISAGQKFDITDLHYAGGVGFRWLSPFGPIRVDYGLNLNPGPKDKFGNFHFSVGSAF